MTDSANRRWLLPDGAQETLPPDAYAVEQLRHRLLELYQRWGYDLVMPAMIEYLDSLLTGTAHSLDTRTFTLVDQLSGKQMGVRSDMTPQVARIDAHLLADEEQQHRIARLCYCGHLLHATGHGLASSRTPLQIGAEIFGSDEVAADLEVVSLMIETCHAVGLDAVSVDIGHVGIFRSLAEQAGLDESQEEQLFDMLQRKSVPDLKHYLANLSVDQKTAERLLSLALMNGDLSVIEEAKSAFADSSAELMQSLQQVETVFTALRERYPDTHVHCDLSELRGYSYHTGLVFAAYLPGQGKEIARGGRYNDIGAAFGNPRPATGFSADLLTLYQLAGNSNHKKAAILAPSTSDQSLQLLINQLRQQGESVVLDLSDGKVSPAKQQCDRVIIRSGDGWAVQTI